MYKGQTVAIPLGIEAINSDDPQTLLLPTQLTFAKNVSFKNNRLEKDPGSKRLNNSALPSGVKSTFDWWPNTVTQRLLAVTGEGRTYKINNQGSHSEITNESPAPITLSTDNQTHMMSAGAEVAGNEKKVFIFTGKDPIQVISGDGSTRRNISNPAADWSNSNQPSFGFMHRGRVIAMGNLNDPHRIYVSDDDNHEKFDSGGATASVYPGTGERLLCGFTYKSRAYLLKYPVGVYYIDDSAGADPTSWFIREISSEFGAASAHPIASLVDDALIANSAGSITSVAASQSFGDIKAGDILSLLRAEDLLRQVATTGGILDRHAVYYSEKKQALFTYRARGKSKPNGMLVIDYAGQKPRVIWCDKDQANCLSMRKDHKGILRPVYGSEDGYVYLMDQSERNVGGTAYRSEVHTPHMDFSQLGAEVGEKNKQFQSLELVFESTGRWNVYVEVFIDGNYVETIPFQVSQGPVLDHFKLDHDRLTGKAPKKRSKPLHGCGRRISFRLYHEEKNQNFKLLYLKAHFKVLGQSEKDN